MSQAHSFRHIGVPLDGTIESQHAVRWAISLARRAQCDIDIVHVLVPPALGAELYGVSVSPDWTTDHARSVARERLTRVADAVAKFGVRTTITILEGAVPSALADHFEQHRIDLIIMATHDRSRLEHLLFGSVAESVTKRSHVPVLLIPPSSEAPSFAAPVEIKRVLLPLDGSAFAAQILPAVSSLSALVHPEITLLRVIAPGAAGRTSTTELAGVANDLRGTAASVHTFSLVHDDVAGAIIDYAAQHAIDVVAMTTHGHGALARLVAGGVADAVLRESGVPLLMLRPSA